MKWAVVCVSVYLCVTTNALDLPAQMACAHFTSHLLCHQMTGRGLFVKYARNILMYFIPPSKKLNGEVYIQKKIRK